jgi:peptidyl-prolyl cis-trans isomerase SurA
MRTLVFVIVLLFAVLPLGAVELDRVVAVVNGEVITWAELYRAMEFEFGQRLKGLSQEEKLRFYKSNEARFLQQMIDGRLQLQEARARGLQVSQQEVEEAIRSIRARYGMDEEAFLEALRKEGFALQEYKQRLAEQILISKLVSQEVRQKLVVSDEEVRRYIREQGLQPQDEPLYHILQIFFKAPQEPRMRPLLEQKAQEAHERVSAGEDFLLIARLYSQGAVDLGYIEASSLAEEFRERLQDMKPGQVSRPFWSQQGLHIIMLQDVIMPGDEEALLRKAREALLQQKFARQYRQWLRRLKERSFVEIRL